MDSSLVILAELVLVFAGVIGFGLWQLRSLRKERAREAESAGQGETGERSPGRRD